MVVVDFGGALAEKLQGSKDNSQTSLRVHVPNDWVLGFWVIVIIVQAMGKYMIIRYLDP